MIGAVVYKYNSNINILPIFIKPIIVDLPKVVAFFGLVCAHYNLKSRNIYYYVRLISLILLILCAIAQAASSWIVIT